MTIQFKNQKELTKELKRVAEIAQYEVAKEIREILLENIKKRVYSYKPKYHIRSGYAISGNDLGAGSFYSSWIIGTKISGNTEYNKIYSEPSLMFHFKMNPMGHGNDYTLRYNHSFVESQYDDDDNVMNFYGDARDEISNFIINGTGYYFPFKTKRNFWRPTISKLGSGRTNKRSDLMNIFEYSFYKNIRNP